MKKRLKFNHLSTLCVGLDIGSRGNFITALIFDSNRPINMRHVSNTTSGVEATESIILAVLEENLQFRYLLIVLDCVIKDYRAMQTVRHIPCNHRGTLAGSPPFSGVSPHIPSVPCSFTSLFRRSSRFPGVSSKLFIILVFTNFPRSSSLFTGVLYSCYQISLNLHQLSLKLPITFLLC